MVKQVKKFRITHIDQGVEPATPFDVTGIVFGDPNSGRWPKVSFSDGVTLSYMWLTNTKLLFIDGRCKNIIVNEKYADAIREFYDSDRNYNESNWNKQPRRVSTWKPEQTAKQVLA